MFEFRLPDIGEGLSEAELLVWTVKVGERVAEGDELAQISTDKVNVDLPSPTSGLITELCCDPGDVVAVGSVIVRIDDGREAKPETVGSGPAESQQQFPNRNDSASAGAGSVKAAPLVRRYAAEHDVDLRHLAGSGPGGQIMRQDIDDYLRSVTPGEDPQAQEVRLKLSGPRLAAARRLARASNTLATTTLTFEVMADAILGRCERVSSNSGKTTPLTVIAACLARALQICPKFNATINDEENELILNESINLGLAVDTDDGLLVPVLKGLDGLDESQIAEGIADLAQRARSGALQLAEMQGSTFTLSSTGGLEQTTLTGTTPIINLPNVATLWISRINQRARVIDGELGVGPVLACSLSFDHRYLNGADGIEFINELGRQLDHPDKN
jgi:pyruvate/2-oxoglutarate dehydrogenase complex dihydrolipoamide acyltransferase (E2) component